MSQQKTLAYYQSLEYDVVVRRETDDGETWYVAYCEEFGLAALHGRGDTPEEAIRSFREEKTHFIAYLYERGEAIPEPLARREAYSGIFTIRITPWLHSRLAASARKEKASLNAYVSQLLAYGAGQDTPPPATRQRRERARA